MTETVRTRPLTVHDESLLAEATLGNLNWREPRFTGQDVADRREFRRYTRLVPGRGDFGLVAERAGAPVGVAWAQLHPADDAGYGFVDEATPEVSLWVRQDCRGRGLGRTLLRLLRQEARARGVARLSLSVESGNHARLLYAAEGFVPVAGRERDGVMLWDDARP